jgi:isoquinoline 1-oxidoreductase beta subunit
MKGARRIRAELGQARPLGGIAWLEISPSGLITALTNVGEMGQGSVSGLLRALADELDADWNTLRFKFAPVSAPYDGAMPHYAGGSLSIRMHLDAYRRLGAKARAMLVRAASQRWRAPQSECTAEAGNVRHAPSGRLLSYGELAADAAKLRPPFRVSLKSAEQWRYIGKSGRRLDLASKVDGSARYGIDVQIPDMRFAAIRHCPVKQGRLIDVDASLALGMPGVRNVVKLQDAVAVVADGFWAATKALNALEPKWDIDQRMQQSSEDLAQLLDDSLTRAAAGAATDVQARWNR